MMASLTDLEIEEQALGDWPRRLLHLPTMTSYEWEPGNIYGSHVAPEYNAITYTWGRWSLDDGECPHVRAIEIHNVPWDIPRIRPDHFTSDELMNVLQSVARNYSWGLGEREQPVKFLWLDIACIDQRSNEPRSAAEVGRQASIFTKAKSVGIWLTTIPHQVLHPSLATITLSYLIYSSQSPGDGGAYQLYKAITRLFDDPWFSSLWTLQEAFLRQDATLLSKEGLPVLLPPGIWNGYTSPLVGSSPGREPVEGSLDTEPWHEYFHELYAAIGLSGENTQFPVNEKGVWHEDLRLLWEAVDSWALSPLTIAQSDRQETFLAITDTIIKSGLPGIGHGNPLAVYTSASGRTTLRMEDRIYGIQQIFKVRVGTSMPNYTPGVALTLSELEVQFGEKLLQDHPVLSQMYVLPRPVPLGTGWRVRIDSIVLEDVEDWEYGTLYPLEDVQASFHPRCTLSVRRMGSQAWGHFEGPICRFSQLREACDSWSSELKRRDAEHWEEFWEKERQIRHRIYRCLRIALDETTEISPGIPQRAEVQSLHDEVPPMPGQGAASLACWQAIEPFHDRLQVLLLGKSRAISAIMLGVLLLPTEGDGFSYYQRVGICWWNLDWATSSLEGQPLPERPFLLGEHTLWEPRTGLFG